MKQRTLRSALVVIVGVLGGALGAATCGGPEPVVAWPVSPVDLAFFTAPDTQLIVPPPVSVGAPGTEVAMPGSASSPEAGSADAGSDAEGSDGSNVAANADVPRMRVHLIDVGQGASTLVEFPCAAILIDTGGEVDGTFDSTRHLIHYLDAFFQSRPDLHDTLALLVLTHPHIDHTRGAMAVWHRFNVANVVTDGQTSDSGGAEQKALMDAARARGVGLELISADAIPAGGLTDNVIDPVHCSGVTPDIRVLWGVDNKHRAWNMNNQSVVTKITFGKASILITGDLQNDAIDELLKRNHDALAADVYEVGHHGSYNATTRELLDAIHPKLALIGMGPYSRQAKMSALAFGHPRAVTIDLLEHALTGNPRRPVDEPVADHPYRFHRHHVTAPIFATGWDGNVRVSMYADGMISVRRSGR